VRAEVRRRELLGEADRYIDELVEEVGPPSPAALGRAESLLAGVERHGARPSAH